MSFLGWYLIANGIAMVLVAIYLLIKVALVGGEKAFKAVKKFFKNKRAVEKHLEVIEPEVLDEKDYLKF